jgi:hypothetical protein
MLLKKCKEAKFVVDHVFPVGSVGNFFLPRMSFYSAALFTLSVVKYCGNVAMLT